MVAGIGVVDDERSTTSACTIRHDPSPGRSALKLVCLTDVPGLLGMSGPDSLISSLDLDELDRLVAERFFDPFGRQLPLPPCLARLARGSQRRSAAE